MNIESVINTELINLNLTAETKIQAINSLIDLLYKADRISDKGQFLQEVLDREETESQEKEEKLELLILQRQEVSIDL